MLRATVLVPTHDHGPTLRWSVGSALRQTVTDFELFLVGDGVPAAARDVCEELAAGDARVRFFDLPKGPRHGELHRHEVLGEARGRIVAYLSDDDLWLPEHLAEMDVLLADADFAHTLPLNVEADGEVHVYNMDLSSTWYRPRAFDDRGLRNAYIPLTFAGHTLASYRDLPVGWETTPKPLSTDRYMWHKLLRRPHVRARTSSRVTAVHFASLSRRTWTMAERLSELEGWQHRLASAPGYADFLQGVIDGLVRTTTAIDARPTRRAAELIMRRARVDPRWRRWRDRA